VASSPRYIHIASRRPSWTGTGTTPSCSATTWRARGPRSGACARTERTASQAPSILSDKNTPRRAIPVTSPHLGRDSPGPAVLVVRFAHQGDVRTALAPGARKAARWVTIEFHVCSRHVRWPVRRRVRAGLSVLAWRGPLPASLLRSRTRWSDTGPGRAGLSRTVPPRGRLKGIGQVRAAQGDPGADLSASAPMCAYKPGVSGAVGALAALGRWAHNPGGSLLLIRRAASRSSPSETLESVPVRRGP
jgi:hypothetical protein